ncbi:MAG: PorT family protein [Saprospiraceae bacterium]|nr:PorT family protein [Saprospiraceae bacterium]
MKYLFGLAFVVLLSTVVMAQEEDEIGGDRPEEIQNIINNNQERFVFELTHDRALGDDAPDVTALSRGFNVYYMKNVPLGESKFSVAPGLGIANRQVYMDQVYTFTTADNVQLIDVTDQLDKTISKLNFTYAELPVELRYSSNPDKRGKSFKVATGFRAGYLLSSKFKYKGQVFDGTEGRFVGDAATARYTEKFKIKKLENLVNYRVAPSFRMGYGSVNVFGLYHLNDDFDSGRGPDMKGYSIGVSISSF